MGWGWGRLLGTKGKKKCPCLTENKKRRRRRKKKSTKGVEKQAALQYQLVLEQQKNQALEKKIQEQTTKTDGLTTQLTKLLNESRADVQQDVCTQSFCKVVKYGRAKRWMYSFDF